MTDQTDSLLEGHFYQALPRIGESKLPPSSGKLISPDHPEESLEEFQPVQGMLYALVLGIAGWLILLAAYHYSF